MNALEFQDYVNNIMLRKDPKEVDDFVNYYLAKQSNLLPASVEYVGFDPEGFQDYDPTVFTIHTNKIECGRVVIVYVGADIMADPVAKTPDIKTVKDLKEAASALFAREAAALSGCKDKRLINISDALKLLFNESRYSRLAYLLKKSSHEQPLLPDISDHICFLPQDAQDDDTEIGIIRRTGIIEKIPIAQMDYILCSVKKN
ncbi:MAG: hypothetical protein IJ184_04895 [Alphaproteobacteria bacterium]|nr:hypothetical protein [Alphaproteobacteria bacterium]